MVSLETLKQIPESDLYKIANNEIVDNMYVSSPYIVREMKAGTNFPTLYVDVDISCMTALIKYLRCDMKYLDTYNIDLDTFTTTLNRLKITSIDIKQKKTPYYEPSTIPTVFGFTEIQGKPDLSFNQMNILDILMKSDEKMGKVYEIGEDDQSIRQSEHDRIVEELANDDDSTSTLSNLVKNISMSQDLSSTSTSSSSSSDTPEPITKKKSVITVKPQSKQEVKLKNVKKSRN